MLTEESSLICKKCTVVPIIVNHFFIKIASKTFNVSSISWQFFSESLWCVYSYLWKSYFTVSFLPRYLKVNTRNIAKIQFLRNHFSLEKIRYLLVIKEWDHLLESFLFSENHSKRDKSRSWCFNVLCLFIFNKLPKLTWLILLKIFSLSPFMELIVEGGLPVISETLVVLCLFNKSNSSHLSSSVNSFLFIKLLKK